MTEHTLTFKCLGHTKRGDLIESYQLEVTDTRDGTTIEISIPTRQLISAHSMMSILLGRKIFYSVTQRKHARMLSELFDQQQPDAVED
ncbi:hypothetical protein MRY17_16735 [Pseudomonas orientalis]|uniref:hypothetical protein n=1 Tax=Pseudomonas orientalis TaxID=76758 RepID=UPI001FAF6C98|nr:hypothetical protein [Pseudomonas orientalis]UOB22376.1 hypothetical protein MRY17_16735 [Pseudomonas orientalis]